MVEKSQALSFLAIKGMLYMNNEYLEVDFKKYCQTCQHEKVEEQQDPCNECLKCGYNANSHKPMLWREKKE